MLKLRVLSTGSDGNCYFLEDSDGQILILDCGVPFMEIKKALNFDFTNVAGCFVTHRHIDHYKSFPDIKKFGIPTFSPFENQPIRENKTFGNYYLTCFKVPHNDNPNYGVVIKNGDDRLLYCTDMEYIPYTFRAMKINHFVVECNYQKQYLDLDAPNKEHKILGHCGLDTLIDFLKQNQTEYMKNIVIVHMGVGSCNPKECVTEIERTLGALVDVDYARPNESYDFRVNKSDIFT